MNIHYKKDNINKTHYHVFMGNFEIASIHGPCLNGDYIVYTVDNYKQIAYKSFDECINYLEEYLNAKI